jgi:lincosamide nucleotidyltransferase A/C/D/E
MMRACDVVAIVDRLTAAGVPVWLDGGWGVDGLLGWQSRDHDDLDLVIPLARAAAARRTLEAMGFTIVGEEATDCFVAVDAADRRVDVHPVDFDDAGAGYQRQANGSDWRYPPEAFAGRGRVAGREIACLSAAVQLLCHLNYEPDETDRRDMHLLAEHCGIELRGPYLP